MRNDRLEPRLPGGRFIGIVCHKAAKIKFCEQLPEENIKLTRVGFRRNVFIRLSVFDLSCNAGIFRMVF